MTRFGKKDAVTPKVREEVLRRDGWRCVAPVLAQMVGIDEREIDPCLTTYGHPMQRVGHAYRVDELQIDHVRDEPGGRRISKPRWLQALCPHHHLDGFATRKDIRQAARRRLAEIYEEDEDGRPIAID